MGRRDTGDHQRFGGPSEGVHQQHREFRVTVGDVGLHGFVGEGELLDDFAEGEERFVDVAGFFGHGAFGFGFFEALAASEVDEGDLAVSPDSLVVGLSLGVVAFLSAAVADQINGENGMTSRAILVHLVAAHPSVLHTFVQHCYNIPDILAVYDHEILDKEPVGRVPSALQDTTCGV